MNQRRRYLNNPACGLLGCGIFVVMTLCVGLLVAMAVGITGTVFAGIRSSEVYQQALERTQEHPQAQEVLGEPIEAGWWVTGSLSIQNSSGEADLSIPVSGPRRSGTLSVKATKTDNRWQFETLELSVDELAEPINLLRSAGL